MPNIDPSERQSIAIKAGLNPQYLYQCLTGRRDMDPRQAVLLEQVSGARIRRWHVRRDWRDVWPELIDVHGAQEARDAA